MPRGAAVKQYTETFSLREKPASERFGQSRSLPKLVDVVMCSRVGLIGETLYLLARNHNDPNWVILKSPPKPCVLDKIKRFLEANLQGPPTRRRRRSAITSARASGQQPTGPILFIAITPTSIWDSNLFASHARTRVQHGASSRTARAIRSRCKAVPGHRSAGLTAIGRDRSQKRSSRRSATNFDRCYDPARRTRSANAISSEAWGDLP